MCEHVNMQILLACYCGSGVEDLFCDKMRADSQSH